MRLLFGLFAWALFITGRLPHPAEVLMNLLPGPALFTPTAEIPKTGLPLVYYWPIHYLTGMGLYLCVVLLLEGLLRGIHFMVTAGQAPKMVEKR